MSHREGYKKTKIGWIPEDWDVKIIGDFTEKVVGGASLKPTDFITDGFKVLPKKGIVPGGLLRIREDEQAFCSIDYANSNNGNIVDNEYLITTLRDLVPTGPSIGYIVKFNSSEQFILAQGVYGLKTSSELDRDFLIQFSNTKQYRKVMQTIMVGSTQVHIRNKDFLNVLIPYPPLPEQKKIASILTTVDDKISSIDRQIQQTEQLKKGLMEKLLTEGIGHTEFKDTKIGRIPKVWDCLTLAEAKIDIVDGDRGANYPKQDDFLVDGFCLFLTAKNVSKIGFRFDENQYISEERDGLLRKGKLIRDDIVITTRGTVGNIAWYNADVSFDHIRINSGMALIRKSIESIDSLFLYLLLRSHLVQKQIRLIAFGSAQPQLTIKEIKKFRIVLPPIEEQTQIASILSTVDDKIEVLTQKKAQFQTLKKGLSQQLLTGQMRVKV